MHSFLNNEQWSGIRKTNLHTSPRFQWISCTVSCRDISFLFSTLCMIAVHWNRKIIDCKVTLQKLSGVKENTLLWLLFYSTWFYHIKMFLKPLKGAGSTSTLSPSLGNSGSRNHMDLAPPTITAALGWAFWVQCATRQLVLKDIWERLNHGVTYLCTVIDSSGVLARPVYIVFSVLLHVLLFCFVFQHWEQLNLTWKVNSDICIRGKEREGGRKIK